MWTVPWQKIENRASKNKTVVLCLIFFIGFYDLRAASKKLQCCLSKLTQRLVVISLLLVSFLLFLCYLCDCILSQNQSKHVNETELGVPLSFKIWSDSCTQRKIAELKAGHTAESWRYFKLCYPYLTICHHIRIQKTKYSCFSNRTEDQGGSSHVFWHHNLTCQLQ